MMNKKTIALAGNPNVGKSTLFNALTGMHQHTGNWSGKTVDNAAGHMKYKDSVFQFVDLPGAYSLHSESPDEKAAGEYIASGKADIILMIADATCLERNLLLICDILAITDNAILCVNLMDEAKKKGICPDIEKLSQLLGIPVIATAARSKKGLPALLNAIYEFAPRPSKPNALKMNAQSGNDSATRRQKTLQNEAAENPQEETKPLTNTQNRSNPAENPQHKSETTTNAQLLTEQKNENKTTQHPQIGSKTTNNLQRKNAAPADSQSEATTNPQNKNAANSTRTPLNADEIYAQCVTHNHNNPHSLDRKIDQIVTSKKLGFPIMILLLILIFWLTMVGANYPSAALSAMFGLLDEKLRALMESAALPDMLTSLSMDGLYTTLTWVVSVMLPPMAIFFPLFTLLEDFGYLPRVAFNLDHAFKSCGAHGKQALTMCMVDICMRQNAANSLLAICQRRFRHAAAMPHKFP